MLKIRFQRVGKKNRPHFRLVLVESGSAAQKKAQEILGFWDPVRKEGNVKIERVKHWLNIGAEASPTAYNFLITKKVIEGKKIPVHKHKRAENEPVANDAEQTVQQNKDSQQIKEIAPESKEKIKKELKESKKTGPEGDSQSIEKDKKEAKEASTETK